MGKLIGEIVTQGWIVVFLLYLKSLRVRFCPSLDQNEGCVCTIHHNIQKNPTLFTNDNVEFMFPLLILVCLFIWILTVYTFSDIYKKQSTLYQTQPWTILHIQFTTIACFLIEEETGVDRTQTLWEHANSTMKGLGLSYHIKPMIFLLWSDNATHWCQRAPMPIAYLYS